MYKYTRIYNTIFNLVPSVLTQKSFCRVHCAIYLCARVWWRVERIFMYLVAESKNTKINK